MAKVAQALLATVDPSPGVRLLGVSAANLVERPATQLSLGDGIGDGTAAGAAAATGRAVEDVRRRFGDAAVGPAVLLGGPDGGLRLRRMGDQQWGPRT
jgi:hypothetical protein